MFRFKKERGWVCYRRGEKEEIFGFFGGRFLIYLVFFKYEEFKFCG